MSPNDWQGVYSIIVDLEACLVRLKDGSSDAASRHWWAVTEIALIFLLMFLFAGWPPPDVNEAHYLAKAKHYWQPTWCAGDHFLESADAHLIFYWTFGWLTRFFALPTVAWIGRFATWGLLAWSWRRLSFAALPYRMASVLTACLLVLFTQRFHMAGEWVIGGVEAKGFAFVLVFLALEAMLRGRWRTTWILLGLATSFHVLVGGWSLIAAGCAWLSCGSLRPSLRSMIPAMVAGALLALPGLIPAIALSHGADPQIVREANDIYVYQRLSHHLVFHRFPHWHMARHGLLLIIWLAACTATPCELCAGRLGHRPLRGFVGGAVALAIAGIIIDQSIVLGITVAPSARHQLLTFGASLSKYYWYRLSDAMLPVGAAIAVVAFARALEARRRAAGQWALAAAVLIAGANLAYTNYHHRSDLRPRADVQMWENDPSKTRKTYKDWLRVCRWINAHTAPDARFLTPYAQQTFKWYAGRSEVCSWKDVPQDAKGVVEWWQRQREVYPRLVIRGGLVMHGEDRLKELADKYDVDYILVDRTVSRRPLLLTRVYPPAFNERETELDPGLDPSYEVYRTGR